MPGLRMVMSSDRLPLPLSVEQVSAFLVGIPTNAEFTVTVFEGGNQRDPYPVAYILQAKWTS